MDQFLTVIDTTLRDGEQSAGVSFTPQQKITLAKHLDHLGVNIIEAGIPAMGKEEQEVIHSLLSLDLKSEILTWNRMRSDDIEAALQCGSRHLHMSVPVSDIHIQKKLGKNRKWVLQELESCIEHVFSEACALSIGAEDASRADEDFLVDVFALAIAKGVTRIRYADTLSVLSPFTAKERIESLIQRLCDRLEWSQEMFHQQVLIDFHGHNDLGMGTANALGAFMGGAYGISCSINGLGERAGNTPLEEIVSSLLVMEQVRSTIQMSQIMEVSSLVETYSGRMVQASKPIVGTMVFSHEAGIHVDGLLKDRSIYEFLNPEVFGRQHAIVQGKHSGKSYRKVLATKPAAFLL